MSLIIGTEYCKLDSNGRFRFPIALKRQLGTDDGRFVIRCSTYDDCLELWTYDSFRSEVEQVQKKLNPYSTHDRALLRELTKGNLIELDTNDRMLIPSEQRACIKGAKDIVLQSTGNYIEIWDYDKYQKLNDGGKDLAQMINDRLAKDFDPSAED